MAAIIYSNNKTPQQVRPTSTFLGLPAELRDMIYKLVNEQEEAFEYLGSDNTPSQFCMPVSKLHPPTLCHVCRQTREEYLSIFLNQTYFRISATTRSGGSVVDAILELPPCPIPDTKVSASTKQWFEYVESRSFSFRKVQFRLSNGTESWPEHANLTITYMAKSRSYRVDFKIDDGWIPTFRAGVRRLEWMDISAKKVLKTLTEICARSEDEVLGWSNLLLLRNVLSDESFDRDREQAVWNITDPWSADVPLCTSSSVEATS